ncbi:hypothetical protein BH10PSE1_BH10PSE1_15370 [soil metagenome]
MGLFDFLTGGTKPPTDPNRATTPALRDALMALNRDTAPFRIRSGKAEKVDLVAEWKIVDARWYEIFAKAGIKRVFKVLMKFDEDTGQVRAVDQEFDVEWRAGLPELRAAATGFRGQKWEASFETVYAFREEDLSWGKVYEYRFNTDEIKKPLVDAAREAGWGWRGVAFGKL